MLRLPEIKPILVRKFTLRNSFIIAPLFGLILISCHNRKQVQTETQVEVVEENTDGADGEVTFQLNYTGTVRDMSQNEGCGWMIELDMGNGQKQLLEPLTLDEAYQIDGKVIEFSYTDSRRPSQCSLASKPITIDNIIK